MEIMTVRSSKTDALSACPCVCSCGCSCNCWPWQNLNNIGYGNSYQNRDYVYSNMISTPQS